MEDIWKSLGILSDSEHLLMNENVETANETDLSWFKLCYYEIIVTLLVVLSEHKSL